MTIFGGVIGLRRRHFEAVNGYSNRFFHWGSEDDDLYDRIKAKGLRISRYPLDLGRFTMLRHENSPDKVVGVKWNQSGNRKGRHKWDGLNSLEYVVVDKVKEKLFTRILVDINETRIMSKSGAS